MDDILEEIAKLALVPVIEIPEAALAVPLADALVEGGLPCAEVTFRTAAAADAMEAISRARPNVLLGAGTVLLTRQVDAALHAGARFIVSPGFDPKVVAYCQERAVVVLPGVVTPTEVQMALALGLEAAKFFPAEAAGGAGYLKALCGPFRTFRFVPTGGIDVENVANYLALPQVIAVGSSWMAPKELLNARNFQLIARRVREATDLVRILRPEVGASVCGSASGASAKRRIGG
jgi:2-dehydro-3-deoxyphosphogluconate aldolase/(4S)-4-hydroxy-2-oxoglutarate aldolase